VEGRNQDKTVDAKCSKGERGVEKDEKDEKEERKEGKRRIGCVLM
jgi:hypothetical protein